MHFIIGLAFALLSGSVAAQDPVAESTSAPECYAPNVWAYCADKTGNPLPPICSNPEKSNPDTSEPKLCTPESSCSCDKPVPQPAAETSGTSSPSVPDRSYPPPLVTEWGGKLELPKLEKNLKDLQLKSSYIDPFDIAEYPEDVENINQQSGGSTPLNRPEGFSVDKPSPQQNINPPVGEIPQSANEMFNLDTGLIQNRPAPVQQQTPSSENQNELKYEAPAPTPGS